MARGSSYSSKQPIPQNRFNTPRTEQTTWDELNVIRSNTRDMILRTDVVRDFSRDQKLREYLNDPAGVGRMLNSLAAELEKITGEFREVASMHEGRTGNVEESDYMTALDISMRYFEMSQRFSHNAMPIVTDLLIEFDQARQRLAASQAAPADQSQQPEG